MTKFTGYREPDVTLTRSSVTASNRIQWANRTRDVSPTQLLTDMPIEKTIFGRASKPRKASVIDCHASRSKGRTDTGMGAWRKAMGLD